MTIGHRLARGVVAAMLLATIGGCSSAGGLGNVLGSVLGGGAGGAQGNQVDGTVLGVDTRAQQIGLQLSNGQQVGISYDRQTRVVYQNQEYAVTALERGDRVTMRVQSSGNAYYTDLVQVDQSVSSSSSSPNGSARVQALQGTVGRVDRSNGLFELEAGNGARILVSLPAGLPRNDVYRFQQLRSGDVVRLYGVFVTQSRVELRQFY